mmetsp:Transcript_3053/g.8731  ORF Transcript_3053/g.8731 Transcript_3053/m.8731 type:complete len:204 (-) Transcript_3053:826-1437(-)
MDEACKGVASPDARQASACAEGMSRTPPHVLFAEWRAAAMTIPTTPMQKNKVITGLKFPGPDVACKWPTTSGITASPEFCNATATPYAVPSCFCGTVNAKAGQRAPAKIMYTPPRQIIESSGRTMKMPAYVVESSTALHKRQCVLWPRLSMRLPKAGVPVADTMKSKDMAKPANCIASACGRPRYQVSTKKAEAMLLKGRIPQ